MRHRLRPVGLGYVRTAPLRLVFVAEAAAPPEAVFTALADVEGWPRWYRQVAAARSTDDGRGREIRLKGGTRFTETVMAADPAERYAYRVDRTNIPGLRALLEEWRLVPSPYGTGSLVRYTFAVDGVAPLRGALRLLRPGLRRAFRDAVRALDRQLAAAAPS
ncbi:MULTISPECIES: SRPBCC family protein [Streptomyces]|uniref:SRPBCC family protein n=1 Tax=Streptomyces lonegramiae TaxID=3075524 RepID=A0ABU2XA45_9ACTN|nr:SRPBCC family protein [Streptomyces sp. DSM 41529]MDT0542783.1 SRPBCC family protein [Streptomyces sp. DSM 41529]